MTDPSTDEDDMPPTRQKLLAAAQNEERDRRVLAAAMLAASAYGYRRMTRENVADSANVAVGSVNSSFGTMDNLRRAVMFQAVADERLDIIAQGLVERDPIAMNAPEDLKTRALATLV